LSLNGTDGSDGKVILALGVLATVLMALVVGGSPRLSVTVAAVLAFAAIAIVGIIDFEDIRSRVDRADAENVFATIRWGIYLVLIGGIVGTGASIAQLAISERRSPVDLSEEIGADVGDPVMDKAYIVIGSLLSVWLLVVLIGFLFGAGKQ